MGVIFNKNNRQNELKTMWFEEDEKGLPDFVGQSVQEFGVHRE